MSKSIQTLEQKTVEVGGKSYLIHAFPAKFGLSVMEEMANSDGFSVERMVEIIIRSVDYAGQKFNETSFNFHFSRRYKDIGMLFNEVLVFNFGEDMEFPLEEESSERSDTSED